MPDQISGRKIFFNVLATTTPKLLMDGGGRQALVILNGTSIDINLGFSGSLSGMRMVLGAGQVFHDLFSTDEWWVTTASSSGTVSGYAVV